MLSARLRNPLLCGLTCLALASCDESQITPPEPAPPGDTTGPSVVSVAPDVGATGVQGATTVRAAFSERLQPSTVTTSTFTVSNSAPVSGSVSVTDSIGVFTPDSPLDPNTTYTARITTGIKDLSGNALASDYTWTFTTGAPADTIPPIVVDVSPANNASGVVVSTTVRATFSELMDESSFDSGTFVVSGPAGTVSGTVALSGAVASFTPASPLEFDTTYEARITNDAEDLAGNHLIPEFVFHFTTAPAPDETRPVVESVQPLSTETGVDTGTAVKATFSESMNPATVNTSTFRLAAGASDVSGTVTLTDFTATFTPASPLAPGTVYTATVTTGVEDLAGNALASSYVWQFTTAVPPDVTPPTVTGTSPANGATGIATGTTVTATFSEPMDSTSVTATTFRLSRGATSVGGSVSLAGSVATFTPSSALLPSTVYTARITTGVEDRAGNNLASEVVWTFTTAAAPDLTPPVVQSVLPPGNAADVAHNTAVQATFSEPVKASTVTTASLTLTGPGGGVSGSASLSGTTATLTPSAPLAANTSYTARVTTNVEDLAGNHLPSDFVWTFTTAPPPDTTPPTVSSRVPASGATAVGTNAVVQATFSEPMSAASITTTTFTLTGGAGAVSGTVSLAGTTATFTPAGPLAYGTSYTARVTTGAEDAAGNNLAQDEVWTFTTADPPDGTPPTITGVTPNSAATNVDVDGNVTATFSEAVLPASVSGSTFSLAGGSGGVSAVVTLTGQTATLNPGAPLAYGTTYTALVTTGVQDLAGNHLAADFTWTFTTEPAPDGTPPTVASVTPPPASDSVAVDANITATFSESVLPASVNASTFAVAAGPNGVAGTVTLNGLTATLNPTGPLAYGTTYTAVLTVDVEDLAGNHLADDFMWTFTTEPAPNVTPPTVTSTSPVDGAPNVDVDATIRATFSEDVLPSSVTASTMTLTGGSGTVAASVSLSGTTASLRPDAPLAFATSYTGTITTGVQDLDGNHLASTFTWTFTTQAAPAPPDTTGPAVGSVTPAQGATLVAVSTNVSATFTESIDPASVTASTFHLNGSSPVTGVLTVSGATVTLNPNADLATNTTYTATLTTGIRDLGGAHLASNRVWSFTTTHLAPIANAGPDQTVGVGTLVTLDGSGSSDPEGQPLTYTWHQARGDPVNGGTDLTGPRPTFLAPPTPQRIDFQLRVGDGDFTRGPSRVRIDVVRPSLSAR